MRKTNKIPTLLASGILLGTLSAQAQLTWDTAPGTVGIGDGAITTDTGTWDTINGNWTTDAGVNNIAFIDGEAVIFGDAGANYTVNVADGGITVGDLNYTGSNRLLFSSVTDNLGVITIKAGGAIWDTGGGEVHVLANTSADALLSISSGDTLTVTGGGIFNGGEKPTGANWVAAGATLDVTAATDVRGSLGSIGQFASVELAGGSSFRAERNGNQGYANDWVLNGDVTFKTRWARQISLTGAISGTGRVTIDSTTFNENQVDQTYIFGGTANTYTEGTTVDGTSHVAVLGVNNDNQLGAVPATEDADNIILKGGGYLRLNGAVTLDANRGVTLDDGGGFIASSAASTVTGKITGTGGLLIGRTADGSGNVIELTNSANDYTGGTTLLRGTLKLSAENALGSDGALTVGGLGGSINTTVDLEGYDVTTGGIASGAGNTRQIRNNGVSVSTITADVANGESHSYDGNFVGTSQSNLIKNGQGTQIFNKASAYTTGFTDVTVNEGTLELGNNSATTAVSGAVSVTGGNLLIGETLIGVTSVSVTGGSCRIGADSYLGDVPVSPTADYITLDGGTLNAYMQSSTGGSFEIDANRLITLGAGGGTIQTTTPSGAWYVSYNGVISGTGALTKASAQTLELGGANTYTGATTITGGTFRLTGSLTSDVTVQSGIFVAGDSATGTGTGTLTALTFDATGKISSFINSDSSESGKAIVSGAVNIDPATTLTLIDRGTTVLAEGTELVLVEYGSLTGTFDGLVEGATVAVGSNNFTLSYVGGTGSMITLTAQESSTYDTWAAGYPGLTDTDASLDFDGGSLDTGIEYVVGGDPTDGSDDVSLAPTSTYDGSGLVFTYRRTDLANDDAATTIYVEYGSDLAGWTTAEHAVNGVDITVNDDHYDTGVDQVIVTLPEGLAVDDKLFARLRMEQP